jgi:hypothetical protein
MPTRIETLLVGLGCLIGAGLSEYALAQPSALTIQGVIEGDVAEGRVARIDPQARTITLDNGRDYLILPALALDWASLRTGTPVRIRFSVDAGRNIATALDFSP